jgi:hypothetical protein
VLHGLADPLLPFNQSQLVYTTTTAEGNEAIFTLVPDAGHPVNDIAQFLHVNLSRARA